jgi:hypothetical protein
MTDLVSRESLGLGDEACVSATSGLCNLCGRQVDAKIVFRGKAVVLVKWCPEHGITEGLVSSDKAWYLRSLAFLKPGTSPRRRAVDRHQGCPNSCGLCPDHQQHTCVPLLEITSDCDIECPICLVRGCVPGALSLAQIDGMVDGLVASEGKLNMLTLSGGEPTRHPQFLEVVDRCLRPEVGILSISTNGLALAADPALARALAERGVVVSLQLDGFSSETCRKLRGQPDLGEQKRQAIANVLAAGGRLSLTFTLAAGVNEHELPEVLDLLFREERVVSVMVQPLARMNAHAARSVHGTTIPDAVRLLAQSSRGVLRESDFTPLPCSHPTCFALTYLLKLNDGTLVSLPSLIEAEPYLDLIKNQALLSTDVDSLERIREALYRLWSSDGVMPQREGILATLRQILLDLGRVREGALHRELIELGTRNVKSVFIHHFMDRSNFDFSRIVKCCNHYPQTDGRLLPACVRNNLGSSTR